MDFSGGNVEFRTKFWGRHNFKVIKISIVENFVLNSLAFCCYINFSFFQTFILYPNFQLNTQKTAFQPPKRPIYISNKPSCLRQPLLAMQAATFHTRFFSQLSLASKCI